MVANTSDEDKIVEIVEICLRKTIEDFSEHREKYFTENDIVCNFHMQLKTELSKNDSQSINGIGSLIVHTEFPTPFRCKMKRGTFARAGDDERTERGNKYKRGHFDVVVFNPSSIARFNQRALRSQSYEFYQKEIAPYLDKNHPLILYGIEFGYDREPLTVHGARLCNEKALQDHDKLDEAIKVPGFMMKRRTVIFAEPRNVAERQILLELKNREGIELVMSH